MSEVATESCSYRVAPGDVPGAEDEIVCRDPCLACATNGSAINIAISTATTTPTVISELSRLGRCRSGGNVAIETGSSSGFSIRRVRAPGVNTAHRNACEPPPTTSIPPAIWPTSALATRVNDLRSIISTVPGSEPTPSTEMNA